MLRRIIRQIIQAFLLLGGTGLWRGSSILMYHSVGSGHSVLSITPMKLERQFRSIARRGGGTMFLSEFAAHLVPPKGQIIITFDDGYAELEQILPPLLERYQLRASIFLPTGLVGGEFRTSDNATFPVLTREQINRLLATGRIEFLPHGVSHRELPTLESSVWRAEIDDSARAITEFTACRPHVFGYPRGRVTPEIKSYLADRGWIAAVGVVPGLVTAQSDRYQWPRANISEVTDRIDFLVKTSDAAQRYATVKQLFQFLC